MKYLSLALVSAFLLAAPALQAAEKKATTTITEVTTPAATTTTATATVKPKREMSEKQKHNVAVMRACGAEWRAAKTAGKVKDQKWRTYLAECRKRQA